MIFLIVKATVSCLFDQDTHALDQTPPITSCLKNIFTHPSVILFIKLTNVNFSPIFIKKFHISDYFSTKVLKKAILAVDKKWSLDIIDMNIR